MQGLPDKIRKTLQPRGEREDAQHSCTYSGQRSAAQQDAPAHPEKGGARTSSRLCMCQLSETNSLHRAIISCEKADIKSLPFLKVCPRSRALRLEAHGGQSLSVSLAHKQDSQRQQDPLPEVRKAADMLTQVLTLSDRGSGGSEVRGSTLHSNFQKSDIAETRWNQIGPPQQHFPLAGE